MRALLLFKGMCFVVFVVVVMVGVLVVGYVVVVLLVEIYKCVQQEKLVLIDIMKILVLIELGSKDIEGLDKIVGVIVECLCGMGGDVKFIDFSDYVYCMVDMFEKIGKMVFVCFKGEGKCNIMLIVYMDIVYLKGMFVYQLFCIDGECVYGLGIVDDKNGVVVILYMVLILQVVNFKQYGMFMVLINGDEEISLLGVWVM